jgi:hypothetical protein
LGNFNKYIFAFLAAIICLVLYVLTLQPGVTFMDSGELGGAIYTFGIPHPTGYPLYLLIGYIVSNLPIGDSPIYRLNLLSALFSSAAVFVFYFVFYNFITIFTSAKPAVKEKQKDKKELKSAVPIDEAGISLIAFFSALILGVSKTFWGSATFIEVYPLHELFFALIILICFKIYINFAKPEKKYFIYLFLVLGLSFANHMTTVLILPAIVYLLFLQKGKSQTAGKMINSSLVFIIPGLLLYALLVIRASAQPFFNWSDPQNLPNLWHHVTGGDYSQMMFSGGSAFINNIKLFGTGFINEFAIAASLLGLFGLFLSYKTQKQLFTFGVILMLSSLLYALNYSIRDIEVYFIQFNLTLALFIAVGIYSLSAKLSPANPKGAIIAAGAVLVLFGGYYNYSANNNSSNFAVEDYTMASLNSTEQNAVYFTYEWGFTYPAALYYQQAENKRLDVKVFNAKFLSGNWYIENIKKYYPDVYAVISKEAEDYMRLNPSGDERSRALALSNLVKAFTSRVPQSFPFYLSADVILTKDLKPFFQKQNLVPWGIMYKFVQNSANYENTAGADVLNYNFRIIKDDTPDKKRLLTITCGMLYETAFYHYTHNNSELALKFLDKSLSLNSNFTDAVNLKNKILTEKK